MSSLKQSDKKKIIQVNIDLEEEEAEEIHSIIVCNKLQILIYIEEIKKSGNT